MVNKEEKKMNLSKQVKSLGMVTAIGAASVLSSTAINAAVLTFAEGNLVIDSDVTTNFTLNLVADGFIEKTYGGGINITFDTNVVNVVGATFDPYWNFANTLTDPDVANATGGYEIKVTHFSFSPSANTVRQNIASIDFAVVGTGAFDFGFFSLGAVGDWAYTPDLVPIGEADLTYCMTLDSTLPTTCLDSITDPTGRELLTLSPTGITVASTVVPVPAAVWLFGSGLIGLVAVSRRKTANGMQKVVKDIMD